MRDKTKTVLPEWAQTIKDVRHRLNISQPDLAAKLRTSAMTISRWERGQVEPSASAYIGLGKFVGDPLCWFFWGRAGLSTADVIRVLPTARRRLLDSRIPTVQVVLSGAGRRPPQKKERLVAIPLLPVCAAAGEQGDKVADLDQLKPDEMLAVPRGWCRNPASTVSLKVKGDSMAPLILDGYIIAVDTSDICHDKLLDQIVVAFSTKKGLVVSRLIRFKHLDVLCSDHREYEHAPLATQSGWRILGRVLWWVGQAR